MFQENRDGQKNSETAPEALKQELEALRGEHERLLREYRRSERELKLYRMKLERIRKMSDCTAILNRVVAVKRSELEHFINLIMQNSPNFILMFDGEGRMSFCTNSFLRGCGIPNVGMIRGLHYRELFELYTKHEFVEMMDTIISSLSEKNRAVKFTEKMDFDRDGVESVYSVQIAQTMDENGEPRGFMAFFHDITELMDAKREAD
ncbi:MAG: PAS domain S-box protein, partial [Synergistaceae bacterium]|nr:PAS domain S-box protein [Synergistaceae bacterium]